MLRWPPAIFWNATLFEISAAIDGFAELKAPRPDVMTRDELEELKALYG
jgi:hypothetical protein